MIQKCSILSLSDKSGVKLANVFQLYKGGKRKVSGAGNFIKISAVSVTVESVLKKKKKSIALITSTKKSSIKKDASKALLLANNCVLLKRKLVPRNKDFNKPCYKEIKRKKLQYKFPGFL